MLILVRSFPKDGSFSFLLVQLWKLWERDEEEEGGGGKGKEEEEFLACYFQLGALTDLWPRPTHALSMYLSSDGSLFSSVFYSASRVLPVKTDTNNKRNRLEKEKILLYIYLDVNFQYGSCYYSLLVMTANRYSAVSNWGGNFYSCFQVFVFSFLFQK